MLFYDMLITLLSALFIFFSYNAIKAWMLENANKKTLGAGSHMLAAAEAG